MITYEMSKDEMVEDLERLNFNDKELDRAFESLRCICRHKGLPYYEVMTSKFFNHNVKYILKDNNGVMSVIDLDNGKEWEI